VPLLNLTCFVALLPALARALEASPLSSSPTSPSASSSTSVAAQ